MQEYLLSAVEDGHHLLLFQMAVAAKRLVKVAGIEAVRKFLPKKVKHVHLIFVVPNGSTLKLPSFMNPMVPTRGMGM